IAAANTSNKINNKDKSGIAYSINTHANSYRFYCGSELTFKQIRPGTIICHAGKRRLGAISL
ncbi:MAG: hypothetical protein ACPGVP_19670, partial [Thiolinea sp.]